MPITQTNSHTPILFGARYRISQVRSSKGHEITETQKKMQHVQNFFEGLERNHYSRHQEAIETGLAEHFNTDDIHSIEVPLSDIPEMNRELQPILQSVDDTRPFSFAMHKDTNNILLFRDPEAASSPVDPGRLDFAVFTNEDARPVHDAVNTLGLLSQKKARSQYRSRLQSAIAPLIAQGLQQVALVVSKVGHRVTYRLEALDPK